MQIFQDYNIMTLSYYQHDKTSVKIHLKVIPNSSKNEICDIIHDSTGQHLLKLKITAIADNGKANKALIKFLSKEWNISSSNIEILSGHTARVKKILVTNHTDQFLAHLKTIQKLTSIV